MFVRHRLLTALLAAALVGQVAFAQEVEPAPVDPAVQTVLESKPNTPAEVLRAVITLYDLGAPAEAQQMLETLQQAKPDEAALAEVVDHLGSGELLRLINKPELEQEAKQFVASMLVAADNRARDPQRLAALVTDAQNSDPARRRAAVTGLREAKTDAVAALLTALARAEQPEARRHLKSALVQMGFMAVGPLLGALESDSARLRADAIEVLGVLRTSEATYFLIGPAVASEAEPVRAAAQQALRQILGAAPTAADAQPVLLRQVQKYFARVRPREPDHQGLVELWIWDDAKQQVQLQTVAADDLAMLYAARLTPYLYALAPQDPQVRLLHFTAQLEAAKMLGGYESPLAAEAGSARAEAERALSLAELETLLQFATEQGYYGAAIAAAEILGDAGTPALLVTGSGEPAPLVQAVQQGDRRLRFAALAAIMELGPTQPYPGSSHVADALGHFAGSAGEPRAIVGHPRVSQGQDLAALLSPLGYETSVASSGRDVLSQATLAADADLVLIHSAIQQPPLRELLYQLRRDPRTRRVPIGVLASVEDLPRVERIAAGDPLTLALPMPHSAETLARYLEQIDARRGRSAIGQEERARQAEQALTWIGELVARNAHFYDLRSLVPHAQRALHAPALTQEAAPVLGALGTAAAQRALVELASRATGPIAARRAAAEAFRQSVAEHGLLLTTDEILRQYDVYNSSATLDKQTQQVRASILDAIEARTSDAESGKRKAESGSKAEGGGRRAEKFRSDR